MNLQGERGGTVDQNLVGLCSSCNSTLQESIIHPLQHRSSSITDASSFVNTQLRIVEVKENKEEHKSSLDVSQSLTIPLMISAPNNSSKRYSCKGSKRGDS
mmetsp:Transcript_1448/g.1441  ORF Transcript_1448/g.1441 Transcript_1448/m.1441 type:complete len:101 (+) Transcript_1448:1286-1588(+)